MLPIPHLLLFVPICIFTGLAIAAAATQLIARIVPPTRFPTLTASAEIFYFTPRKTPLPSYSNSNHAGPQPQATKYRAFDGG